MHGMIAVHQDGVVYAGGNWIFQSPSRSCIFMSEENVEDRRARPRRGRSRRACPEEEAISLWLPRVGQHERDQSHAERQHDQKIYRPIAIVERLTRNGRESTKSTDSTETKY